jgi:hypothetical protein
MKHHKIAFKAVAVIVQYQMGNGSPLYEVFRHPFNVVQVISALGNTNMSNSVAMPEPSISSIQFVL